MSFRLSVAAFHGWRFLKARAAVVSSNPIGRTALDFNFKNTRLATIPLSKIRENAEALRTTVEKDKDEYKGLVDSVRTRGVMQPILVREVKDPASGELFFGLIDGLHRFNAAIDAGLEEIPANIGSLEDADLIEAQILANVHRIETKPVQYTKALLKVLAANPLLTYSELAARLAKSTGWLEDRLSLDKLDAEIQKLVDNDELNLMNAYALAKLPADEQKNMLQGALSQSPGEFVQRAKQRKAELDKARREGRKAEEDKFVPVPRLKKLTQVKDEFDRIEKDPALSLIVAEAKRLGLSTIEDVTAFVLKWMLHLDPAQLVADEQKWKTDKANHEAEKARKKAEREAKKAEKATQTSAAIA